MVLPVVALDYAVEVELVQILTVVLGYLVFLFVDLKLLEVELKVLHLLDLQGLVLPELLLLVGVEGTHEALGFFVYVF